MKNIKFVLEMTNEVTNEVTVLHKSKDIHYLNKKMENIWLGLLANNRDKQRCFAVNEFARIDGVCTLTIKAV